MSLTTNQMSKGMKPETPTDSWLIPMYKHTPYTLYEKLDWNGNQWILTSARKICILKTQKQGGFFPPLLLPFQ